MFEILEHTADLGFRATGRSLPELFENAAQALVAISIEIGNIEPRESHAIAADGDSRESLLVNWLSEILYQLDGRRFAIQSFKIHELVPWRVVGEALGEPRNPERHPGNLIVKGVTYHQLKIEQSSAGWSCEVYIDI